MTRPERWIKGAGLALGMVAAVLLLMAWRVPGGNGTSGLDLTVIVNPTGELQITPPGPLFFATGLRPGDGEGKASGTFEVRNRTGANLLLRVRALPSEGVLDGVLRVELRAGGATLYSGRLEGLRAWSDGSTTLAPGAGRTFSFRAWLPGGAEGYAGQVLDLNLEFQSLLAVG